MPRRSFPVRQRDFPNWSTSFVSEVLFRFVSEEGEDVLADAERMIASGHATTLLAGILESLAGERLWEQEITLRNLRKLEAADALLGPLATALRDQQHAERRNAARCAFAALAAPDAACSAAALAMLTGLVSAGTEPDVRILAAAALGESGNAAAMEALSALLRDVDPNVAAAAAEALGVLGEPAAIEALGEVARSGPFWVRAATIVALGRIGDERGLEPVAAATADEAVAEMAAVALGEIGDPRGLDVLRPLLAAGHPARRAARDAAAQILLRHPDVAVPEWLRESLRGEIETLLQSLHDQRDETAAYLLGIAGTRDAARHLVDALESSHADAAAAGLSALPAEVALEQLIPQLERAEGETRSAILAALPPLGNAAAVEAVVRCLADPHPATRAAASEVLGRSDDALVVPRLLELIGQPEYRRAVVRALGIAGAARCNPLAELLNDPDPEVRRAAAEGLARCATREVRARIVAALHAEADPEIRASLALAIGTAGGSEAVAVLAPLLEAPELALRFAALTALGQTGTPEALHPLVRALADPHPELQAAALRSLGTLGDPRAAEAVGRHLTDADRDLRLTAAFALRDLAAPRSVEYLLGALTDRAWPVRLAAVRTLAAIGATETLERLRQVADEDADPLVRQAAQGAVAQLAGLGGTA
jgi:HEAT repeat protein